MGPDEMPPYVTSQWDLHCFALSKMVIYQLKFTSHLQISYRIPANVES